MRGTAAGVLLITLVLAPTTAFGQWSASGSGTATVSAATLANATNFRAECLPGKKVRLLWNVSADLYVEGYEIARTSSTGTVVLLAPVARTTSSVDDAPPAGTQQAPLTYTYTIRAGSRAHAWTTALLASTTAVSLNNNSCTLV